jgi:RNase P subunit RPR2
MGKKADLCRSCEELLKEGYTLKMVRGSVDNKITCAYCGRRRYGSTFDLEAKRK